VTKSTRAPSEPVDRALGRRITRIAVPALGALAAEPLYLLADTAIVGRLGKEPLAAIGVAYGVLVPLHWLFSFLEGTTVTRIARLRGEGDTTGEYRVAADALAMALVIGVSLFIVVLIAARPLAWLLGGRGEVLELAIGYLRIAAVGLPLLYVALVGHGVLQGREQTKRSLVIVVIANVVNVVLELWFVHGLHWGLRGSAWGTVIAQAVTALIFIGIFHRVRVRPNLARIRGVLRDGTRLIARTLGIAGVFAAATTAANRMGSSSGAAHQTVMQLFTFLALCLDALALAGQVLVAERLGADDRPGAEAFIRRLLRISIGFGLVVAAFTALVSGVLPRLFIDDGFVQSLAVVPLIVLGALCVPGAVAFLYDGVYQGTADYNWLVKGTLGALVVFIPGWLVVMIRPSVGLNVLWMVLAAWMVTRAIVQHAHFRNRKWLTV
jgi:putative MATE family efflux protein